MRGEQGELGRVAFDQGVGRNGGGVHQQVHGLGRDRGGARFRDGSLHGLHEAVRRIGGRGGDLDDIQFAGRLVHQRSVGERAPDVDAQPVRRHGTPFASFTFL